jgi:hypothetical protein
LHSTDFASCVLASMPNPQICFAEVFTFCKKI